MRILDPNFRAYVRAEKQAERNCQKAENQAWHKYFKTVTPYKKTLEKIQKKAEGVRQEAINTARETLKEFKAQVTKDYFKNKRENRGENPTRRTK